MVRISLNWVSDGLQAQDPARTSLLLPCHNRVPHQTHLVNSHQEQTVCILVWSLNQSHHAPLLRHRGNTKGTRTEVTKQFTFHQEDSNHHARPIGQQRFWQPHHTPPNKEGTLNIIFRNLRHEGQGNPKDLHQPPTKPDASQKSQVAEINTSWSLSMSTVMPSLWSR